MRTTYFYSADQNDVCRTTTKAATDKFHCLVRRVPCDYVPVSPAKAKELIKNGATYCKIKDIE